MDFAGKKTGYDPASMPYFSQRMAGELPFENKELANNVVGKFNDVIPFPEMANPNEAVYQGQGMGQANVSL